MEKKTQQQSVAISYPRRETNHYHPPPIHQMARFLSRLKTLLQTPHRHPLRQSQKCHLQADMLRQHNQQTQPEQSMTTIQNMHNPSRHLQITTMVQPIHPKKASDKETTSGTKSRPTKSHWNLQNHKHRSTIDPRIPTPNPYHYS